MYIYLTARKQVADVKLLLLHNYTWNHLSVCKKWAQAHLKMLSTKGLYKSYIFNIYMYIQDLALNNVQGLICHKTQPTNSQDHNYINDHDCIDKKGFKNWVHALNIIILKFVKVPSVDQIDL